METVKETENRVAGVAISVKSFLTALTFRPSHVFRGGAANPLLLISLGLAGVGYGAWAKWSFKIQLIILVVTGIILAAGAYL